MITEVFNKIPVELRDCLELLGGCIKYQVTKGEDKEGICIILSSWCTSLIIYSLFYSSNQALHAPRRGDNPLPQSRLASRQTVINQIVSSVWPIPYESEGGWYRIVLCFPPKHPSREGDDRQPDGRIEANQYRRSTVRCHAPQHAKFIYTNTITDAADAKPKPVVALSWSW